MTLILVNPCFYDIFATNQEYELSFKQASLVKKDGGCRGDLPLAHWVSISVLAQLVRAACRPLSEFASKYRTTSFTFLAWLLALETYKFANMYSGPHPAGPESTIKGYDIDGTAHHRA